MWPTMWPTSGATGIRLTAKRSAHSIRRMYGEGYAPGLPRAVKESAEGDFSAVTDPAAKIESGSVTADQLTGPSRAVATSSLRVTSIS